jgi:diaminopimelate dehydrogenase
MRKARLAIIGAGKLGRACAEAMAGAPDGVLAGVVRHTARPPEPWLKAPSVTHISELGTVDAALVCVPPDAVLDVAHSLLQRRIPVVECARLHGEAFLSQKAELHRVALHHKVAAVVGAGCDPGALSLLRSQFALLAPHAHTETRLHAGGGLHHSLAACGIAGVRQALATERKAADGSVQRYVYVELEPSADAAAVEQAIRGDPLFLDEDTRVFAVDSLAALEESRRGVTLERRTAAGEAGHAAFLLEARYDEAELAARMMLAAARALPALRPGAYSLLDLPPGALWGELRPAAEKEWM